MEQTHLKKRSPGLRIPVWDDCRTLFSQRQEKKIESLKKIIYLFYMCVCFVYLYVCTSYAYST